MAELTSNPWMNDNENKTGKKSQQNNDNKESKIKENTDNLEAKNKQQNNQQNKNQNRNKKQKNKNQKNKKKGKNKNRNKKKQCLKDYFPRAPYELRDRKPINYKNVSKTEAIDYNGYDTDEELNKLHILKQQYPGFDSDEDCDLDQDDHDDGAHNETKENETKTESKSENSNNSMETKKETEDTTKPADKAAETAIVPLEIDPKWDYDELMANKPLVLGSKYRWNFCSSYFSNETLQHIYDASFPLPSAKQYIKYEAMLKECIKRVTKYHSKTMDDELKKQFEAFPERYRIQFSDSILMFDGIDSVLKGRSVRVGFFKTNKDCNDKKTNNASMLIAYADNKQFVAESQQFLGIKGGGFKYESRKWALAEDHAFTNITGTIGNTDKWMDIALIVGVSIVNRLLNPSLPDPHRMNSIYKQELFDVTDLLPPFDDLQSLFKNDSLWWIELEKRIERGSNAPSDVSSYQGSLQDFIDDTVIEPKINIKEALSADYGEGGPPSGMLNEYLLLFKEYKEEDDESYTLGENEKEKNEEDYEAFIDETIGEDLKELIRENMDVEDKTSNLKEENDTKNRKRKRDITQIEKEGGSKVEVKEECAPPTKKQKVSVTAVSDHDESSLSDDVNLYIH